MYKIIWVLPLIFFCLLNSANARVFDEYKIPVKLKQVSINGDFGCGIDTKSNLVCWGNNNYGQAPLKVSYGKSIVSVTTFHNLVCVIFDDNTFDCKGENSKSLLEQVPYSKIKKIAKTYGTTCTIALDNTLYCWSPTNNNQPVKSLNKFGKVRDIDLDVYAHWSDRRPCVVLISGELKCLNTPSGITIPKVSNAKLVFNSDDGGCVLLENGKVNCWGDKHLIQNLHGKSNVKSLTMEEWFGCAALEDSTVSCSFNKKTSFKRFPVEKINKIKNVTGVLSNSRSICLMTVGNNVHCIGKNTHGELLPVNLIGPIKVHALESGTTAGDDFCIESSDAVTCMGVEITDHTKFNSKRNLRSFAAGREYYCGINEEDAVVCRGYLSYGDVYVPANLPKSKQVVASTWMVCSLSFTNSINCWGDYATEVPQISENILKLYGNASGDHICALTTKNISYCWSRFGSPISQRSSQKDIAVGSNTVCGVDFNNKINCWGDERYITVNDLHVGNVKKIAVGWDYVCALDFNDTMTCYYNNSSIIVETDVKDISANSFELYITYSDRFVKHSMIYASQGEHDVDFLYRFIQY